MRVTVPIGEAVMRRLEQEAERQGRTISNLAEAALRRLLDRRPASRKRLPPLPAFDSGGALLDIVDRDARYRAMEARS